MTKTALAAAAALASLLAAAEPGLAHEGKELGKMHFQTSCTPEAQTLFDQAMLFQHSFWYSASGRAFEDVLKTDPGCAIAYWGYAQSLLANPFNPTPPKNLALGLETVRRGQAVGAKTQRENDFIASIGAYYADYDKLDQRKRAQVYLAAMEKLARSYPNDDEAQIYYALALNIAASPSDKMRRW